MSAASEAIDWLPETRQTATIERSHSTIVLDYPDTPGACIHRNQPVPGHAMGRDRLGGDVRARRLIGDRTAFEAAGGGLGPRRTRRIAISSDGA